ncbi:hypothetical protein KP509_01G031800 [Ceratopteris richardii]|uniref:Uncharacterized protein n=1 Tax=Ceratopteris richardii TaxID=49495 RepID=A0A8T2VJP1_CERRI|nr:hypothetical protein KP509_01G031800 [Ceratopteris richardii]
MHRNAVSDDLLQISRSSTASTEFEFDVVSGESLISPKTGHHRLSFSEWGRSQYPQMLQTEASVHGNEVNLHNASFDDHINTIDQTVYRVDDIIANYDGCSGLRFPLPEGKKSERFLAPISSSTLHLRERQDVAMGDVRHSHKRDDLSTRTSSPSSSSYYISPSSTSAPNPLERSISQTCYRKMEQLFKKICRKRYYRQSRSKNQKSSIFTPKEDDRRNRSLSEIEDDDRQQYNRDAVHSDVLADHSVRGETSSSPSNQVAKNHVSVSGSPSPSIRRSLTSETLHIKEKTIISRERGRANWARNYAAHTTSSAINENRQMAGAHAYNKNYNLFSPRYVNFHEQQWKHAEQPWRRTFLPYRQSFVLGNFISFNSRLHQ